jgi:hypothetical protein
MPLVKVAFGGRASGAASTAEWSTRPIGNLVTQSGATPADGLALRRMTDMTGQGRHATQTTEASQPELDGDTADGALMVEFSGDNHLTAALGSGATRTLIVVVDVPATVTTPRPILSRDTTETTTKAALELAVT